MKENKLSNLTIEELLVRKKKIRSAFIGLGIVMILAISILIYLISKSNNYTLLPLVFSFPLTFLPIFVSLNQIKTEIKSRKSNL